MLKKNAIKISYILYAPPDRIFEALTNAEYIEKWSGGKAVFELFRDGKIELFDGWVKGKLINFNKGQSLSYTWKPAEWKPKSQESKVDFTFIKHAAGTELIISHEGFPDQKEADNHKEGWINFVFEPLNDFLINQDNKNT